ncbi:MAG: asparaginase domain-containing protein, partial [Alteraurantiacibacter sp.]
DGLRNFANAVQVAADKDAPGRGVLLVMDDRVLIARDARKARLGTTGAFAGFPRGPVALATPSSVDWLAPPWREGEPARFAFPDTFPRVPILHAYAGMEREVVECELAAGAKGLVLAGMGNGNSPDPVRRALTKAVRGGVPVVRATRVDKGVVEVEHEDAENGFVAARALGPAKARILMQLLLANGVTAQETMQDAFNRR